MPRGAYDEDLAARIRDLIGSAPGVTERKLFGGLAFLVGGNIRMLWNPADDSVTVTVADVRTEELFVIPVVSDQALEAFQHPFRYAGDPVRPAMPVGGVR